MCQNGFNIKGVLHDLIQYIYRRNYILDKKPYPLYFLPLDYILVRHRKEVTGKIAQATVKAVPDQSNRIQQVDDVIEVTEEIVLANAKALPDQSNRIQQVDDVIKDTEKIVLANAKALPDQSNKIQQVLFQIISTHIIAFHIIASHIISIFLICTVLQLI